MVNSTQGKYRTYEYQRNANLKKCYNITLDKYEEMLTKQYGVCAICKGKETQTYRGKLKALCVDHNHKTGKIRGLLCSSCNTMLGYVSEDPKILISAIQYLEEYNES